MEIEELKKIIKEDENAKVDFKQEWYKYSKRIDNEFIRDMIALANGDIFSIEKASYLIIGIVDGSKEAINFDVSKIDRSLDKFKRNLLQVLNNYAQPPFLDLNIEWIDYQEKEILVLSIPPHQRLIYLSKDLSIDDNKKIIPKRTVLYRLGTSVALADIDIIKDFEKAFDKNKSGMIINQTHSGTGDNIGRDKVIERIIYQK